MIQWEGLGTSKEMVLGRLRTARAVGVFLQGATRLAEAKVRSLCCKQAAGTQAEPKLHNVVAPPAIE